VAAGDPVGDRHGWRPRETTWCAKKIYSLILL
jgi:hypothetical protein